MSSVRIIWYSFLRKEISGKTILQENQIIVKVSILEILSEKFQMDKDTENLWERELGKMNSIIFLVFPKKIFSTFSKRWRFWIVVWSRKQEKQGENYFSRNHKDKIFIFSSFDEKKSQKKFLVLKWKKISPRCLLISEILFLSQNFFLWRKMWYDLALPQQSITF